MCLVFYLMQVILISFILLELKGIQSEHSIMLGQAGIFCILYCFYAADLLNIGIIILIGLILLMSAFYIVRISRNGDLLFHIKAVFTPLMMSYIIFIALITAILWNRQVFWDDELRFWGALPKVLWQYKGALQIKDGFQVFSVDYYPGIYVYSYYFEKLNRSFRDGVIFIAYAAIASAMIMPALGKLNQWKHVPLNIAILYFMPLVFFNARDNDYAVFYSSLYVDPLLGLIAGCLVWFVFQKPWKDKITTCEFMLCSTVCVLLKSSGIMFSLVAALSVFVYLLIRKREILRSAYVWIMLTVPSIVYCSWKILLGIYEVLPEIEYSVTDFVNLSFFPEFLKALMSQSLYLPFIPFLKGKMSFSVCFIILTVLLTIISKWIVKSENVTETSAVSVSVICLYTGVAVFTIGLYGLCVGPWEGGLYSYRRYISTVLEMMVVFICLAFLSKADTVISYAAVKFKTSLSGKAAVVVCVFSTAILFPLVPPFLNNTWAYYLTSDAAAISKIYTTEAFVRSEEKPWTSVAFICDAPDYEAPSWVSWGKEWYGHLVNIMTYENIDKNVQILQDKYYSGDIDINELKDGRVRFSLANGKKMINADYYLVMHGNYPEIPVYRWELYKVDEYNDENGELILRFSGSDEKPEEYVNYNQVIYGVGYPQNTQ